MNMICTLSGLDVTGIAILIHKKAFSVRSCATSYSHRITDDNVVNLKFDIGSLILFIIDIG